MNKQVTNKVRKSIRKTQQYELPVSKDKHTGGYDIYPVHNIGDEKIWSGYDNLAKELFQYTCIKLDGYVGILFDDVRRRLEDIFIRHGVKARWVNVKEFLLPEGKINAIIEPWIGGDDMIFGKICDRRLIDFFDPDKLKAVDREDSTINVYYGTGAALVPQDGKVIFFDIAKNEIQFRSRAGVVQNLGAPSAEDPKKMYKRFYFVDWVVLNRHVKSLIPSIDWFVDGQRGDEITWMAGDEWREAITAIATRPLRARPWFEPGAWGGSWIKDHIEGLPDNVVNYAWSFELIYPENGVILESSGLMLETTFDSLLYIAGPNILGIDHPRYGDIFPIRFDFLDTINGGNLSIQCHPTVEYIRTNFGEVITQEETYYILDCQPGSKVYLGFQEGVTPEEFRRALDESHAMSLPINVDKYVQSFESGKHDLFLIPPGTVHASGRGALVLEISATPYLYTFKMYDWLRLDLDDKPRPLNIDRAMQNLVFSRNGSSVAEELICRPVLIKKTRGYSWFHLPTHSEHLYDVHRYEISTEVEIRTDGKVNVLSLVEGDEMRVRTDQLELVFQYAETFVIPASVSAYTLQNTTATTIMVIKAFIK